MRQRNWTRREMLGTSLAAIGVAPIVQDPGERPAKPRGVEVVNPRGRVPVSLIIDDSTCLVNLAHFAIPQFAEVFPDRYRQDWKALPREIPDAFVRKFGEWCHEQGVKGKYSIVPGPACVGWVDRDLPGWSRAELNASLELVRTLMMPDWDIHPEMVTHTWAIDTKTGRPYPDRTADFMENWGFSVGKSADQLANYLAYALRILQNAGLKCEGITTPGGFGNRVLEPLAQATFESVRDVFQAEIPHYFRHLFNDERSVAPRVELASSLEKDPRCVVSIIGCTGDWFGDWDGLTIGRADQFLTEDGRSGRLAEVIARGEPAILVGHWPGFYCNGHEDGFAIFREVVGRLNAHYKNLIWMKTSEIARYWAAKELTRLSPDAEGEGIGIHAPFACPAFTLRIRAERVGKALSFQDASRRTEFVEVADKGRLEPGRWARDGADHMLLCFDLPRGRSRLGWD
ncbi:MAG: hypothetical protein U0800_20180 [Isosphaeraceae bacterium]